MSKQAKSEQRSKDRENKGKKEETKNTNKDLILSPRAVQENAKFTYTMTRNAYNNLECNNIFFPIQLPLHAMNLYTKQKNNCNRIDLISGQVMICKRISTQPNML